MIISRCFVIGGFRCSVWVATVLQSGRVCIF